MNVAIIGCGLIGGKRARALEQDDTLVVVCDVLRERANALAEECMCEAADDWRSVVARADVDAAIVATVNNLLEPITVVALKAGKHVLCEKPLGRNVDEARRMVDTAVKHDRLLKTGFDHRFHPGLFRAKEMTDQGVIGKILTIRARYGHGSRPGMEKEWRSSRDMCGGGELLDQGVHVIDLVRWFGGDIDEVFGLVETRFWNIEVEDNAFAILKTKRGVTAQFHVSWTNWRNIFSFEIFGDKGYIAVHGLGGSYGPEILEHGHRNPTGGRPDIEKIDFVSDTGSWREEWKEFRAAIREKRQPVGNGIDGLEANRVIEAIYESSRIRAIVTLAK